MDNPKNHAVELTEYGIKKMIRDAMKPLIEDNRKLRFMVGMSAGLFAHNAGIPYTDVVDSWFGIASLNLEAMPEGIPTELIMLSGREYAQKEIESVKQETEPTTEEPSPEAIAQLETIMDDFHSELEAWFRSQYGGFFVARNRFQEKLSHFDADINGDSLLLSVAWNGLVKLNKFDETGWNAYDHSARWGTPEE